MPPSALGPRVQAALRRLLPALRAATAVSACIAAGQLSGRPDLGLVMAVGARRVALVDAGGAASSRAASLVLAAAAGTVAAFLGTLAGASLALSALGMFALGFVAGAARSKTDAGGRLAAVPAILFALAQLLPGGVPAATERALAVAVGGTVAILLLLDDVPSGWPRHTWQKAVAAVRFLAASPAASRRFALVLAATVTLCLLAVRVLDIPRGHWVVVSVLVVLRPEASTTRRRGVQRLVGTLLGCGLATGLVFVVHSVALSQGLIFLLLVAYFRLLPDAYGWSLAFLTPAIVLGLGLLEPGNWHWAANRALDVIAGTLVALLVGLLLQRAAPPRAPTVIG